MGFLSRFFLASVALLSILQSASAISVLEAVHAVEAEDLPLLQQHIREGKKKGLNLDAVFMILAAQRDQVSLMEKLIASGVPVDSMAKIGEYGGETALMHAAAEGHLRSVKWLISQGADPKVVGRCQSEKNCEGHTALVGAVRAQHAEIVRALLTAGADPNAANQRAVQEAYMEGHVEIYQMLAAKGGRERKEHAYTEAIRQNGGGPEETRELKPARALSVAEIIGGQAPTQGRPAEGQAARIAIIGGENEAALVDLLTTELTVFPGVEVLERLEIEKVLAEQHLGATLADPSRAPALGAALKADGLLMLKRQEIGGETVLEARFVRVNPGIVSAVSLLPINGVETMTVVRALAGTTAQLAAQSVQRNAAAVALVSVRSAVLSGGGPELERLLRPLLTQRLARHPRFVLLERAALEKLQVEGPQSFWTGKYVANAIITPQTDGSGRFTVELVLEPIGVGEVIRGSGSGHVSQPVAALEEALSGITPAASGAAESTAPAAEAARFALEAAISLRLREPAHALEAADVAWVLGSQETPVRRMRIEARAEFQQAKLQDFQSRVFAAGLALDPFRHPLRAADCPGPGEWLRMSTEALQLWQEGLPALASGDREAKASWLELYQKANDCAENAFRMVHTAREIGIHRAGRKALADQWKASLHIAQALATELGDAKALIDLASKEVWRLKRLYSTPADRLAALRRIRTMNYLGKDILARAEMDSRISFTPEDRRAGIHDAVLSDWQSSPLPDEQFRAITRSPEMDRAGPKRMALYRKVLPAFESLVPVFVEEPRVIPHFIRQLQILETFEAALDPSRPLATKQSWTGKGPVEYSREYRETCRRVLVALFAADAGVEGTEQWVRRSMFTPEDLKIIAPAAQSWLARNPEAAAGNGAQSWRAALKLSEAEGEKVLVATRRWHMPKELTRSDHLAPRLRLDSATYEAGKLWLPIKSGGNDKPDPLYVAKIALPNLTTEILKIPPALIPATQGGVANIFFHQQRVYISWSNTGIFIFDPATSGWSVNTDFLPGPFAPVLAGDTVFQSLMGGGLVEWNPATGKSKLMVSQRRTPAETPLDDPAISLGRLGIDSGGDLTVEATESSPDNKTSIPKRFKWSLANRFWTELPADSPEETRVRLARQARKGFHFGQAVAAGNAGEARNELLITWHTGDPSQKPLPIRVAEVESAPRMGESSFGRVTVYACEQGLLVPNRASSSSFWFIPRAEYDAFARANGCATLPLP